MGGSLVEVADVFVFNQDHGRGEGVQQNNQSVVGLDQVGTEVFNFAAECRVLLLQSLRGFHKQLKRPSQFTGFGRLR